MLVIEKVVEFNEGPDTDVIVISYVWPSFIDATNVDVAAFALNKTKYLANMATLQYKFGMS